MDSTILQLFTIEEILNRLVKKERTGALHVFTAKEAANLFLEAGVIVAAAKGLMEGEEVVRQILEWKEPRFLWQPEYEPATGLKRIEIDFPSFRAKLKAAPKLEIAGKTLTGTLPAAEEEAAEEEAAPEPVPNSLNLSAVEASSSGRVKLEMEEEAASLPPLPPLTVMKNAPAISAAVLTATKNINTIPLFPTSHEESLLRKYKLALVSKGNEPEYPRMRMIRMSSLVGRNPACDFTMDHVSVSRQHCLLQITERGLHVKDLGTTNGTKVNGISLTEGYINVGDKLTIGHLNFVLAKDEE